MMLRNTVYFFVMLVMVSAAVKAADPTAFIINTSAETLSKIDLNTGIVTNDILTLGSDIYCFPNQIIVRDTLAYVLLSGTAEIQVIDLNTESTVGWINFSPGSNPYWMAFLNNQFMYVTLMVDNSLAKVDLVTNQVVKMVEVGQSPEGVIIYRNKAYVAITAYDFASYTWGQGKLIIYDTETDEVTDAEILTSVNPQFFDIDKRGIIHCVCTGNFLDITGAVYLIDTQIDEVIDIIELGGSPGQIAIAPDNVAWVAAGGWAADGEVYTYDAETHNIRYDASEPLLVDLGAVSVAAFQDSTGFVLTFADIISRHDGNGSPLGFYYLGDGPNHMDFNYVPGDVNGDWLVNIGDAVYLVRHIFHSGPRPLFPAWRGDVNADGNINVGDAVYITSLIFRQTEKPKIGMSWLR